MSKLAIVLTIIITMLLGLCLIAIPKHEIPTDAEWEAYIEELDNQRYSEELVLGFSHCFPVQ
jgi:hypothetical protein